MKNWIVKLKVSDKFVLNNLLAFFIFQSLFLTIRVLAIGSAASQNIFEYFISSLSDLFALYVFLLIFLNDASKDFLKRLNLFDKMILVFMITNIILGTILAHNIVMSLYAIRMSYLPMIFYFVARFGMKNDPDQFEIITRKVFNWYIIVGMLGIILFFFMPDISKFMTLRSGGIDSEGYINRIGSIFWSPVIFATFISVAAIYFYYRILNKGGFLNYLIFALFWCCLFLSVTRGAIITFFLAWIFLSLMYRDYKAFLKSLASMALVIFFLWLVDPEVYKISMFIANSSVDTFLLTKGYSRVDLWIASFNEFLNNPMGYGLGKAGHVAVRFFGKVSSDAATFSTDGWYLKLANETGVWGLITYFTLAVTFIIQSVKFIRKKKQSFFNYLFIVFLMVGIQNIVSNVIDFYSFACFYWLLIGFSQNLIAAHE
jgi:hypothetical protein